MFNAPVLFAALGLGFLCWVNAQVARSLLYPAAIFCGWWAFLLFGLFVSGSQFYPLANVTIGIYLAGAAAFSAGCALAYACLRKSEPTREQSCATVISDWAVKIALVILLGCMPLFWSYVRGLSRGSGSSEFWSEVRAESVRQSDLRSQGIVVDLRASLVENLVILSMLVAFVAFSQPDCGRRARLRRWLAILLALIYSLMTAANQATALTLLVLLGIQSIRHKRVQPKLLLLTGCFFLLSFSASSILLSKGNTSSRLSLRYNVGGTVELLQMYSLGQIVAFDRIAQDPLSIPSNWNIWRFFKLTANKFGADFQLPSIHAEYTPISPSISTNAYTMYFAYYPDYGWIGVITILFLLGCIACWIYLRARQGNPIALTFYGITFAGILLSGFEDLAFNNLNFHVKALLFLAVVYGLPAHLRRRGMARLQLRHSLAPLASKAHDPKPA